MKKYTAFLFLLVCIQCMSQDSFQLARPLVKYESIFFKDSAKLELKFAQPGAKIYFTIYDRLPTGPFPEPTEKYSQYKKPIIIKQLFTTVKAKVFSKGFKPSESIQVSFVKDGQKIKSLITTLPNPKYPGTGDSTLFDNNGGIESASSKTWMGFDSDSVWINIELVEKQFINAVLLNFLRNESSWIFLPKQIIVNYYDETSNSYKLYWKEEYSSEPGSPSGCVQKIIAIPKPIIKSDKLRIMIVTVNKMPDWHPAKGQHAWCFIDEIKVY